MLEPLGEWFESALAALASLSTSVRWGDASAWIALVTAVVAIVISGLSARFTRDQAAATRAQAEAANSQLKIIGDQWHEMRRPKIRAWYHFAGAHQAIMFINDGPVDLANVVIELGTVGNQLLTGLAQSRKIEHMAWPVGSGESFVINRMRPNAGIATFRITCASAEGETWVVPVQCEIPEAPLATGP